MEGGFYRKNQVISSFIAHRDTGMNWHEQGHDLSTRNRGLKSYKIAMQNHAIHYETFADNLTKPCAY